MKNHNLLGRLLGRAGSSLAIALCACSQHSGSLPTPTTRVDRVRIEGTNSNYDVPLTTNPSELVNSVEFAAKRVWDAVPLAYAGLSIPTEGIDKEHRLFVGAFSARQTFNGGPVSRLVDCGSGLLGANADSYTVRFRILTQVDSVGASKSNVRTRVDATGLSSGGTVRCTSTGELERSLAVRIKLLLVAPAHTPS